MLSETWENGSIVGTLTVNYDNNFQVISVGINGNTVNYQYDADHLLVKAGDLSLTRNAQNDLLTATQLGNLTTERTHNIFGEMIGEIARYDSDTLYQTEYSRDKLGRITQRVETIEGITATIDYRYDTTGRLIEVKQSGVVTQAYTYDSNGNRLTAETENGVFNGSYDEQDHVIQYGNYTYDYTAYGELLSKNNNGEITQYQYDVLGNLRSVQLPEGQQIEYLIDGKNRRIGKKVNGILTQGFLYQDTLNPVAELDGNGNVVSRFVYGSKANVPDYMLKNGNTYRILSDHLGSPRLVVDISDGSVAQRMDYDAFGNVIFDSNPGFQPFGFAGGIYDSDIKLTRFGARDYDAQTGRWTSKDPILFTGGDANLYGYVLNDPINFIDPYGLFNLILLRPGTPAHEHASYVITEPTKAIVIGHGDYKGNVLGPDGKPVLLQELKELLTEHPEWKNSMEIEFRVCGAGDGENSLVDRVKELFPDSTVRGPYGDITPERILMWPKIPGWGLFPNPFANESSWKTLP
jgi:RHS repeat-associated protein